MCGFTGFIGKTADMKTDLTNMMDRIIHRGPDSAGEFFEGDAALGFRRLSIIDLETGGQPFHNESNSLVAMVNGEIYNFVELRKELMDKGHVFETASDCEVILHGYEEYGEAILPKLRGMFAFAIWDRINKKLIAGRDMFGIKPLYYGKMKDTFFSDLKSKVFFRIQVFRKRSIKTFCCLIFHSSTLFWMKLFLKGYLNYRLPIIWSMKREK